MNEFLGIVRDSRFVVMSETGAAKQLTSIQPQQAVPPDSGEVDLSTLEGKVIKVRGIDQGQWIYSAQVVGTQYFRANIGIVLINAQGKVLALERVGNEGEWQMAQGGLDELEEPQQAAERELLEELGVTSDKVEFLFEYPDWLVYELPSEARKAKHGRGQVQRWVFYRFLGSEDDIDLEGHGGEPREFSESEWIELSELAEKTWERRRPIYRKLATHLAGYLASSN